MSQFARFAFPQYFFALAPLLILVSSIHEVQADLVLDEFGDISWNRSAAPSSSPPILFSVTPNSNLDAVNDMNAFNVGLMIVPTPGATGSLSLNVTSALSDSVFSSFNPPLSITFPEPSIPTINGYNQTNLDVTLTSVKNLFSMSFTSMDALGRFEVYSVPEYTNYFTTTEFDGLKFANAGGSNNVLLGSFSVSAVPEPASVILLGTIAIGYGIFRRVRKHPKQTSLCTSA